MIIIKYTFFEKLISVDPSTHAVLKCYKQIKYSCQIDGYLLVI